MPLSVYEVVRYRLFFHQFWDTNRVLLCHLDTQIEWERDRKGLPAMTFMVFYNAVFELIGAMMFS